MDASKASNNVSFHHDKGFFIKRWVLVLLFVVAATCVLSVGLLVGHLTPCRLEASKAGSSSPEALKPKKDFPYVRLPRSVVPEHYDVELRPYIWPDNFTFDGKVRILVRVVQVTNNITLHANDLTVKTKSVRLTDIRSGDVLPVSSTSEDEEKQFFVLHLKDKLVQGKMYEVYMEFVGSLNDELAGFYRSFYTDGDGNERWLATTQFEPTDARRAFPCFDEPALKATFNITLVRWTNMTSLSNMPIYKTEKRGDNWEADYFEKTVRMSTYVLAFIVSDLESNGTREFSVWSRSEVLNNTAYALQVGPKILKFFETFFNIDYPLPKTDMVAVPDFSEGAMENWGLIIYREPVLLYDRKYSSSGDKEGIATVISHELAHQWFGNLVTPAWWDDLWLNEGFATYVQYLGVNAVHPEWKMEEQFVLDTVQSVMDLDCLKTSHPISLPVRHPDEINEIFDGISYSKGASIIRMMRFFLGERNFRYGLMNYLNAKKFGNAVQDDLWEHLTAVQNKKDPIDVKKVMDSWTLQTGYPVVEVIRDYKSNTAQVKQYRFLLERGDDKGNNVQWEIPFTYTDALNRNWSPTTKLWLHKTNGSISGLPSSRFWIVANLQEVGFYRVNYDLHNWKLLIQQLTDDHTKIHTINRAQIIDDSMNLARAGHISYQLALNTTMYLRKEEEYLPWKSALNSFSFIDSMICRSALYGKWQKYIIDQLKPMYDTLGWEESSDETILKQYMRASTLTWMCLYGHKDCVKQAQEKYEVWKEEPSNVDIISPNLRHLVFCTAVMYGDEEDWNFFWKRYKSAQIPSEKYKFMSSLDCAREPWILTRYLNWSLTAGSGIRRQDGSGVFGSVGSTPFGRDLTFNYIRDKWDIIVNRYGKSFSSLGDIVESVTSSLNTRFELKQLEEFYERHRDNLGTAKRAFEQSVENAKANVRWMDNNYAQLVDWLETMMQYEKSS